MIIKNINKHKLDGVEPLHPEFGVELTWNSIPPGGVVFPQRDWNQTLITRINQLSAHIYQASMVGGADTVRISENMFSLITDFEYFSHEITSEMATSNVIGTISNKYKVIVDPHVPNNEIWVSREASFRQGTIVEGDYYVHTWLESMEGVQHRLHKNRLKGKVTITHNIPND